MEDLEHILLLRFLSGVYEPVEYDAVTNNSDDGETATQSGRYRKQIQRMHIR